MRQSDKQLIFGRRPVLDALERGQVMEKVWFQQGVTGPVEKEVRHRCRDLGIPLSVVPKERLDRLVRKNHQGIIGWLPLIAYQRLGEVLPFLFERGETPLLLLTDGVTDVRNFGAIARSAEVCGAHALVTSLKGGASITADSLKTSAGALNRIPVCREKSTANALKLLRNSGLQILVSHLDGTHSLREMDLTGPSVLVLGAEGKGVSPAAVEAADLLFHIPQVGSLNSFNVSVAAGIMLYEAMLQRQEKSS